MKQFLKEPYVDRTSKALIAKHGKEHEERITNGVNQVVMFWRRRDGTSKEFRAFCFAHFVSDPNDLDALFERFQNHLDKLFGHLFEIYVALDAPMQDKRYKKIPADKIFAGHEPFAHFSHDCFKNRMAFLALLNFEIDTLEEQIKKGGKWTRRRWAESRLVDYFINQTPASVEQEINRVEVLADEYINEYYFFIDQIRVGGNQLFFEDFGFSPHWGLRDHIKVLYATEGSLEAQRALYEVMMRVIHQTVPKRVIDNPGEEWDPYIVDEKDEIEPDTRYEHLLKIFRAIREEDKFFQKNYIERRFIMDFEIFEKTVEGWMTEVLSSPVAKRVGKFISAHLGRSLETLDIWHEFKKIKEMEELDIAVRERYPTLEDLKKSFPDILVSMGFDIDIASEIADKNELDPARSNGHALDPVWSEGRARLRVRFLGEDGKFVPNYDAFETFMHEFGHGVEMYFSTHRMDYSLLSESPNPGFSEALAFVFQQKNLEILGIDNEQGDALDVIDLFWNTFEIAGVSLVDLNIWRWMYKHPDATPEELKNATIKIANKVWNKYFASVFGIKDQPILAVYSHIINYKLYMSNYFLGYLIQHQIQEHLKGKDLAKEVERMFTIGNINPNLWMKRAIGSPISTKPLLASTRKALKILK